MTSIADLSEPLFRAACRFNRMARKGGRTTAAAAQQELMGLLADMSRRAESAGLAARHRRIEGALAQFLDELVIESGVLEPGEGWAPLASQVPGGAGGSFFDTARAILGEPRSEETRDQIAVIYTCLGLGYTGELRNRPDELRSLMADLSSRIGDRLDADRTTRIVPEAYENVNTSDLVEPPARGVVGLGIALVAMAAVVIAGNAYFYQTSSSDLRSSLRRVQSLTEGGAAPASDSGGLGGAERDDGAAGR